MRKIHWSVVSNMFYTAEGLHQPALSNENKKKSVSRLLQKDPITVNNWAFGLFGKFIPLMWQFALNPSSSDAFERTWKNAPSCANKGMFM